MPVEKETRVGNYFVSNYPPFSFWKPERVGEVAAALGRPPAPGTRLVDEAPQWRPSLAQTFKSRTQKTAAPACDPWDHEQWRGTARNLPEQRAFNGQGGIGFQCNLAQA